MGFPGRLTGSRPARSEASSSCSSISSTPTRARRQERIRRARSPPPRAPAPSTRDRSSTPRAGRVRDIEGRIVADEWTYPAPKSRVIELGPELAEQDRSRSSEWLFRGAFGFSYLETSRAASTITAALVLPLSRILPFGASRIVIRLLVRPGAARSTTANRMSALVYQNPTLRFTPTPAIGALVPSPEARDNGSSNIQVLTISLPGALARHAFITLVSGQGDTRQDRFYAAQVGYDDIGPRNHS